MNKKFPVGSLDSVLTGELTNENPKPLSHKYIINRIFKNHALGFPITSLIQHLDKLGAFILYDLNSKPDPSEYDTTDPLFFTPTKWRCPGCV